jgi:predicted secreted protein
MPTIQGCNVLFKLSDKTLVGETSSSLDISAKVKESLTKADKGNTKREVTGHDVTFSVNGVMELNESTGTVSILDSDALIAEALKKGDESLIDFVYTRGGGKAYTGKAIITSYSESADAEGNATYTLNCSVSGDLTQAE